MELTVRDPNQPAPSLNCKVRSAIQLGGPVANCTPPDESGHFFLDLPIDGILKPGIDVLVVQVSDDAPVTRRASVPVLLNVPFPDNDNDGDGFAPDDELYPDCDDANANTYPFAAEVVDGRDNDCDLLVDELTDGADDDFDGMSELEGDCDDLNPDTYLGAPEIPDRADNDCDGIVDENTPNYDDDGDGFAELELDCDDRDPNINPAVPEICGDGIDNNCNSLRDNADGFCVSLDSSPMIVGPVNLSQTAIEVGQCTQASVLTYEADGDLLEYRWEARQGEGVFETTNTSSVTWCAPEELPAGYDGNVYKLFVLVQDDDQNQAWAFQDVWVYKRGALQRRILAEVK
jgi:hypothetical protein